MRRRDSGFFGVGGEGGAGGMASAYGMEAECWEQSMVSSVVKISLSQSDVGNHEPSEFSCQAHKKKKLRIYFLTRTMKPWIIGFGVRLT
jgi:hypothetical protein